MIKILVLSLTIVAIAIATSKNKNAVKKEEPAQSKEMIEIAQNLVLQKDREQAIRLLNKAQATEKNKTTINEIRSILSEIGGLFLYDKSQQEYESSISFKKTDPNKWFSAVERAQKIEPDNTLIMIELVRNQINKKNISRAKEILEEFRLKNAFDKNVILSSIFLNVISGDTKDVVMIKNRLKEQSLNNLQAITSYIDFLDRVVSGNKEKMLVAFDAFKKEDPTNPQNIYWEQKLGLEPKSAEDTICGSFPENLYRRYYYDLFFCSSALDHFFKIKDVNSN